MIRIDGSTIDVYKDRGEHRMKLFGFFEHYLDITIYYEKPKKDTWSNNLTLTPAMGEKLLNALIQEKDIKMRGESKTTKCLLRFNTEGVNRETVGKDLMCINNQSSGIIPITPNNSMELTPEIKKWLKHWLMLFVSLNRLGLKTHKETEKFLGVETNKRN